MQDQMACEDHVMYIPESEMLAADIQPPRRMLPPNNPPQWQPQEALQPTRQQSVKKAPREAMYA